MKDNSEFQDSPRSRGIYLLPNLFTIAGLFAGFYAVVAGMKGIFDHAGIAIFVAMIFDGMDGRVARLTNTQSAFGAQLDSLCDMCSFGVAPALVVYSWSLISLGKLGWLAAFLYTAATALRLARFNTQVGSDDKRFFQGLPCPAAAAIIAGLVWVGGDFNVQSQEVSVAIAVMTITIAMLMVSNVRYNSFKQVDVSGKVPFFAILLAVLAMVFISIDPPQILLLVFAIYGVSGPILTVVAISKARRARRHTRRVSDGTSVEKKDED